MQAEFYYDNQGTNAFLVYRMEQEEQLDTMGIGMISNNHIPHILPISFTRMDENRYLRYNISSKIDLENFFSGMVNKKRLLSVFLGICEAIDAGNEYMLESSLLVLDKRYIFANVATGEPDMVYLPVVGKEELPDICRFFKEIMFSTQFDSSEDCSYVAAIINHLNTNTNFSLKGFKELLYSLKNQVEVQQSAPAPSISVPAPASSAPVQVTKASTPSAPGSASSAPMPAVPPASASTLSAQAPAPAPAPAVPPAPSGAAAKPVPAKEEKRGLFGKSDKGRKKAAGRAAQQSGFAVPGMDNATETPPVQPASKKLFGFGKTTPPAASTPSTPGFEKVDARPPAWAQNTAPAQFGQTSVLSSEIGQTTVLSSQTAGETTVLGVPGTESAVPHAVLVQKKSGKRIAVDKLLFRIGTERSFVDFWVSDNSAVSHSHADIINHDGNYFVRDNNSTNHTYVNGQMIPSNQECPLSDGFQITLGNEIFEFELK